MTSDSTNQPPASKSPQLRPALFDERRRDIHTALTERSDVLASYYKSAIDQLSTPPTPGTERIRVSLICHAIRELINSLPWAMGTTSSERIKPSSKDLLSKLPSSRVDLEGGEKMVSVPRPIATWLDRLLVAADLESRRVRDDLVALLADAPQADHPLVTPWNQTRTWFVDWAHFERMPVGTRALPSDAQILDHLRLVEDVIQASTAAFFDAREAIDDVLTAANAAADNAEDGETGAFRVPSKAEVVAALSTLHTLQHRRVFFEGLRNPRWVKPLMNAKAFNHPPEPVREDNGYIREAYWPEVDYLIRAAPLVPQDVVDVLRRLKSSSNSWVRRATFEIARGLPASEAIRLRELIQAWNPEFGWRTNPTDLTGLARILLGGNDRKFGITFTNMLFTPRRDADAGRPSTTLEEYWYMEELPATVEALGDSALVVATRWLRQWEEFSGKFSDAMDITSLARSDIGTRDGRYLDIEQALIDAVRNTAIRNMATDARRVVRTLLTQPMIVLRKITLHAAARSLSATSEPNPELIEVGLELLADPASHDSPCRVEFADLFIALREHNQPVENALQQALDTGPLGSREHLIAAIRAREGVGADIETRADEEMEHWQQRLLATIGAEHLPQANVDRLLDLDDRLGAIKAPREPDFKSSSWTGPTSPTSREQMEQMHPAQLVTHLEDWRSGDAWMGPSHEGMGRVLEELIAEHPDSLRDVPSLTDRLRPTYLRAIMSGWNTAWKNGLSLDWQQVLDVSANILAHDQASPIAREGQDFDDDPDFRYAKQATIRFLVDIARPNSERIVAEAELSEIAQLLLGSFDDEQAWAEYAARESGEGSDPLTVSLNWQWPIMLRGLINLAAHGPTTAWSERSLATLERELRRDDKAGAGYAVLGEGFAQLFNNNPEWLTAHIDSLFGSETALTHDQQIALTTTLATHNVHPKIVELLRGPLLAALRTQEPLAIGWRDDPGAQELIGRWIVTCIIWDAITPDDLLVRMFFTDTPPAVRGSVIGHIAWSFMHSDHVDPAIRMRLEKLWDERVAHVRETPEDSAELDDFYWFVQSKKFETSWWLPRLRQAAELDPTLSTRGMIGEQLATAAPDNPHDALHALRALIDHKDDSGMKDYDLREYATPDVIAASLDSGDTALQRDATELMNKLGADGMTDLKERVSKLRKK
ncbi:hypothetical protein [Microbacterium sp. 22242]|uniref:hypothetical protein n=1 Tax=Microbacterium sp. 22242 TaxID=3453896 RepID=UPI003F86C5D6